MKLIVAVIIFFATFASADNTEGKCIRCIGIAHLKEKEEETTQNGCNRFYSFGETSKSSGIFYKANIKKQVKND